MDTRPHIARANDAQHPDLVAFVATIGGDATLLAASETYAAAADRLAALQQRAAAATARLPVLDLELIEADGQTRARLLGERSRLAAERAALPAARPAAAERAALAHLHFLSRVAALARSVAQAAQDEIAPDLAAWRARRRAVDRADAGDGATPLDAAARAAAAAGLARLAAAIAPAAARRDRAMAVVGFCEARAQAVYGDGVLLDAGRPRGATGRPGLTFEPVPWAAAARRYARRAA